MSSSSSRESTPNIQEVESPPPSPLGFKVNRRGLSPLQESELRSSCAKICQGSPAPSTGQEFHELLNHHQRLQKYIEDRKGHTSYIQPHPKKGEVDPIHLRRSRHDSSKPESLSQLHIPVNTAGNLKSSSRNENDNVAFEPLEPTHTTVSGLSRDRDDPLSLIRTTIDNRPKTSAAACIDYNGPSTGTSASTSRTNTTYDLRPSTGFTSLALTPADRKSASSGIHRVSDRVLRDTQATSLADEKAKAWMAEEFARRRGHSVGSGSVRPSSRRGSVGQTEPERPQSRAGSIREGIKEYIRPRASTDSLRSTRSEGGGSRGSDSKGGSWWRNGSLRRKGSWSSFRSAKPDDGDHVRSSVNRDGGPDLNRSLPPLPGLDQYKERKPAPMHISQLMNKIPAHPDHKQLRPVNVEDGASASAAKERRRQRRIDLGHMVEVKMRVGSISPDDISPGFAPPGLAGESQDSQGEMSVRSPRLSVQGMRFPRMSTQGTNSPRMSVQEMGRQRTKMPEVTVREIGKSPPKEGFRKRLSRYWGGKKNASATRGE